MATNHPHAITILMPQFIPLRINAMRARLSMLYDTMGKAPTLSERQILASNTQLVALIDEANDLREELEYLLTDVREKAA